MRRVSLSLSAFKLCNSCERCRELAAAALLSAKIILTRPETAGGHDGPRPVRCSVHRPRSPPARTPAAAPHMRGYSRVKTLKYRLQTQPYSGLGRTQDRAPRRPPSAPSAPTQLNTQARPVTLSTLKSTHNIALSCAEAKKPCSCNG